MVGKRMVLLIKYREKKRDYVTQWRSSMPNRTVKNLGGSRSDNGDKMVTRERNRTSPRLPEIYILRTKMSINFKDMCGVLTGNERPIVNISNSSSSCQTDQFAVILPNAIGEVNDGTRAPFSRFHEEKPQYFFSTESSQQLPSFPSWAAPVPGRISGRTGQIMCLRRITCENLQTVVR